MSHSLQDRLHGGDAAERAAACREIADDPSAVLWLESLVGALADPERSVTRAAADALARLAPHCKEVRPLLRQALHGDTASQRWAAAFGLSRLEPPSLALVPAAVEAMESRDGDVRWAAAKLLVETARLHEEAGSVVLQLVASGKSASLRRMAIFALRELAPDHADALRALLAATWDEDVAVRRAALTALARAIAPPDAVVQRLFEVLGSAADQPSRALAAVALGELGSAHPALLTPEQLAHLQAAASGDTGDRHPAAEADIGLRRAATRALARIQQSDAHPGAALEPQPGRNRKAVEARSNRIRDSLG